MKKDHLSTLLSSNVFEEQIVLGCLEHASEETGNIPEVDFGYLFCKPFHIGVCTLPTYEASIVRV